MTTFQDKQPQSRRALRQEERAERPLTDDAETPTDAETPPTSARPTGRRARSNFADGLIEVSGADAAGTSSLSLPVPGDSAPATGEAAETTNDTAETTNDGAAPAWSGPSFGFRSAGFDGSSIPPLPTDDEQNDAPQAAEADAAPIEEILAEVPADDSSVARAFPFAAQVDATTDDNGHQTFQLSEFEPELANAEVEADPAEPVVSEPEADVAPEASADTPETDAAVPGGEPIVVAEPAGVVDPVLIAPEEHTMTRREWRAWRAQQEAAAASAGGADSDGGNSGSGDSDSGSASTPETPGDSHASDEAPAAPVDRAPASSSATDIPQLVEPKAEPTAALSDAMAEFEALTRGGQTSTGSVDAVEPPARNDDEPAPIVSAFVPPASAAVPSIFSVPAFSAPEPTRFPTSRADDDASDTTAAVTSAPLAPPVLPAQPAPAAELQPERSAPETDQPAQAEAAQKPAQPSAADLGAAAPVVPAPVVPAPSDSDDPDSPYVPPVGHWSRQAALDDESQPFENTLSRDVGGGNVATTTNALVLPMIPQRDDFSSMINSTGEIMVTGTIDLPMSVGATGRDSRHYDDPEVDHLFDAFDNEVATTDSAPVRAITAVSSHTATRSGIESTRKQGNRTLTVLIVTACVMAVGVVGLLVAGFVFDIFQA